MTTPRKALIEQARAAAADARRFFAGMDGCRELELAKLIESLCAELTALERESGNTPEG